MALTAGTRLGVYDVTAPIGEGGMGQVWRATDTTLGRQVAIKILPDAFAADPDRLARFEREAKTLASLNHPHIAAIYGFEKSIPSTLSASSGQASSGRAVVHALVMELVEGDDLSQRIARGAIPLDEALPIARQIAEALEAAHEQGIIHRDLKPANIKVRADGTVKVLDFGLAKAMDPAAASSAEAMNSPTITSPAMTARGMILGTAAYMAPEQAKGKPVDRRADVWALGAVLYEMLTGQRAFKGEDTTDTIAAVVSKEPDWSVLPAGTPAAIRTLLRRCLTKDRKRRLDSAGAVRLEIDDVLTAPAAEVTPAAEGPVRARLPWPMAVVFAAALLAAIALAVPTVRHLGEIPPPAPPETRTDVVTPATDDPTSFALSPDGRQIVFEASNESGSSLWLRSLAATTAQPLGGTDGARYPFWAYDSRSIGFFAGGALKRLDLGGGVPQTLAPAQFGRGGMWNADGGIVFAPNLTSPLMRVFATGGAVSAVTSLGPQQTGHRWPNMLPDARHFLYYATGPPHTAGIYLGALDGSGPTRLTPADSAGAYMPTGWLVWVRGGALVAQRLMAAKAALTGEPVTLADRVAVNSSYRSAVSVAATGLVAYRKGDTSLRQLTWVDRSGRVRGTVGDPDGNALSGPRVAPDGRRVIFSRTVQGNADLWLLDGVRMSRATFDADRDNNPLWSPDGTRIAFSSLRTGSYDLYEKLTNGADAEERLVASAQSKTPTSWAADGRFLLYHSADPQTNGDLWIVPMAGDRTPSVFLKTPFREEHGAFSPDGRWLAYQSNESGRGEIYVRPFVQPREAGSVSGAADAQWQVSTAGGINPVWRPDGKELYYLDPVGALVAAPITVAGAKLEPGAPVVLFSTRIVGGGADYAQTDRQYDVAPDGRFLINTVLDGAAAPITLLMNWNPDAKK